MDYTIVVGVDRGHLRQLHWTLPTWHKHKPGMHYRKFVVFYDRYQLDYRDVKWIGDWFPEVTYQAWPPAGVKYEQTSDDRFGDAQRAKMLAGFVHVTAMLVDTPYWLKLDTDTVATGMPDWIDPHWFEESPAIIAHRWGVTKPANQVAELDDWYDQVVNDSYPRLDLVPEEGADKLRHARIISWCGFFESEFTRACSYWSGTGTIPVPSQDGFMWFMAARTQHKIVRTNMKDRGWQHFLRDEKIRQECQKAMQ